MKPTYLYIILLLLFLGCDSDLQEHEEMMSGSFYITLGWEEFEKGNYGKADTLFSTIFLEDDGAGYEKDAYVGLGWSSIYWANSMQGESDYDNRLELRNAAKISFDAADLIITEKLDDGVDVDSSLRENLMTGFAYYYDYLALKAEQLYFSANLDETLWTDVISNTEEVIKYTDDLISLNPLYIFEYDPLIDINAIYKLRAQGYGRIGDYDSARIEANKIEDFECDLDENIMECLDSY